MGSDTDKQVLKKLSVVNAQASEKKYIFKYLGEDRIPAITLDCWSEFFNLLQSDFFSTRYEQFVFRGQRRLDWGLMPTLGRLAKNGIVTKELADEQLRRFKLAVRGRINDNSLIDDPDELWAVGQHHGLMTPLLDWTASPYVALFFAFSKSDVEGETDNSHRVIYAFDKEFVAKYSEQLGIRLIEPQKDTYGRLVNQAGLFTYSPTDGTLENTLVNFMSKTDSPDSDLLANALAGEDANIVAAHICKILIKNEDRDACLKHLKRMNVHHASLFPDLIGASEYCNAAAESSENHKKEKDLDSLRLLDAQETEGLANECGVIREPLLNDCDSVEILERNVEKDIEHREVLINEMKDIIAKKVTFGWDSDESMQANTRVVLSKTLSRKYGFSQLIAKNITAKIFADILVKVQGIESDDGGRKLNVN